VYDIQGRVFGISLVNAHGKCVILHIQRFVDLQKAVEKQNNPHIIESSSSSPILSEGKESSPTTTPRNATAMK
jgi:hypothetical protein